jgi:hypothetical protein
MPENRVKRNAFLGQCAFMPFFRSFPSKVSTFSTATSQLAFSLQPGLRLIPRQEVSNMAEWEQFVFAGDGFLAAYASTEALPQATPYLIGHAVELYLKAVYVAHFGSGKNLDELKFD